MKVISLKVPDDLYVKLGTLAAQRKASRSTVLRAALSDYLSRGGKRANGSFFESAKDLAGSVTGPSDLSFEKSNLEGYGR